MEEREKGEGESMREGKKEREKETRKRNKKAIFYFI